jgi:hypothetical protein
LVAFSDTGSRATNSTVTGEEVERFVVVVPPVTMKPLGVRLTLNAAEVYPGAVAVMVGVPVDLRAAMYRKLPGVVLPAA